MDKRLFEKKHFLWRMFTFSGYMSAGSFWTAIFMRAVTYFCASIILCIVISVTVPGSTQEIIDLVHVLVPVLGVIWILALVPLTRRRLRDAGYGAKSYLWLLLPVIGWILFVVRLSARSVPRKPGEVWFE